MATDSTAIVNLSLTRMGEQTISSIDGTDTVSVKSKLIYTQAQEELNAEGPLNGWKFATRRKRLDRESFTITAFASASSTTTTVTATHTLDMGDLVVIGDTTNYDGEYEVISVSTTVSFVITKTFTSDDATGTACWTSEDFAYRFSIPTSLRVESAKVGGIELSDWEREGTHIVTNQDDADVDFHYIQAITTTTLFPPYFTKVLVLDVAIGLVYALNQDLKAVQHLEFDREKAYNKAIGLDEQEKYVREFSSSWVDVGNTRDTLEQDESTVSSPYTYYR